MTPANQAASIHQRILNKAAADHRPFQELLQYYAIERFLYRLSESPHSTYFVLKGALVFLAWKAPLTRPTRDMDFLGYTHNSVENLTRMIQDVCMQPVEADGMIFDPQSVMAEVIKEEADYEGVRVSFLGFLGRTKIHMRLDVGFADVVTPSPNELELPTIFENMGKPCLRIYPPETVIAEKFQAMVTLGIINSRVKDFYDIWFLAQSMELDFRTLNEAIINTFAQRRTDVPKDLPTALTSKFAEQKQVLWFAFLKKNQIEHAPTELSTVIQVLCKFFDPWVNLSAKPLTRWSPEIGWE